MLYLIVSEAGVSINKNQNGLYGIECLRHTSALFVSIPKHLWISMEHNTDDAKTAIAQEITGQVNALIKALDRYNASVPSARIAESDRATLSLLSNSLRTQWDTIRTMPQDNAFIMLESHFVFIRLIKDTIRYIGDSSNLILVEEISGYYFADIVLYLIPQLHERMIHIGNLLYINPTYLAGEMDIDEITMHDIPENDKREFVLYKFLIRMEYPQLIADLNTALLETQQWLGANQRLQEETDSKISVYRNAMETLSASLNAIDLNDTEFLMPFLAKIIAANESINGLENASCSELEYILQNKIAQSRLSLLRLLILPIIAVILAFAIILLSMLDINKSVQTLKSLFKGLENHDLSITLTVNSGDEFGELIIAFNAFQEELRNIFNSFRHSSNIITISVYNLSTSAEEISTTAHEQSASIAEIVGTVEGNKNLSEQMSRKTEDVARLAEQTQQLSQKGAELRDANQEMIQNIRDQNVKIISDIKKLSDKITEISEAIKIIDSIADQTKMIAFNASLEASSSGKSGARFAVVASEIRRFADSVVDSTRGIKLKIGDMQKASQLLIVEANNGSKQIDTGYEQMSKQKAVFENIVETSQNVAIHSQQISNLSKQQEYASAQIFKTLKEISAGIRQFVTATTATSKATENLNEMSNTLMKAIGKYYTGKKG
jgi:methyl-accepting chemotaxis protein